MKEQIYERGISLPESPISLDIKQQFAYKRIIDEDPAIARIVRESVRFTEAGEPYIVLDAEKLPLAEEYYEAMQERMRKGHMNGNPYCAYQEYMDSKGDTIALCIGKPQLVVDLDLSSRRLVKHACSEEHATEIMDAVVTKLFVPAVPGTLIIDEGDDWDFIHPPIFVVTQREE